MILCINAGSSSLKCALYETGDDGEPERVEVAEVPAGPDALAVVLRGWGGRPDVVAHRIVHGGPALDAHTVVDERVLTQLRSVVSFAPLHLPTEIAAIEASRDANPDAVQVACFGTTFHATMPELARRLAIPKELHEAGVRRFGFHGLSCEYVVDALTPATLGRAVVAHLGSGASLTAIRDGRSVDTTMGLTPIGGIVMATRSGDLDPGVVVHLARHHGYDADGLDALLTTRSGLLGLSGTSGDMRSLLAARKRGDGDASLAVESFCTSVAKAVAALTVTLGGLDTLVFTGGIGERSPEVRAAVCDRLAHLGVVLDPSANQRGEALIGPAAAGPSVRVVATDENLVMARHAVRLGVGRAR